MNFKIVTDSSSNIFSMEDASFSSVPLKIITDQKEFVDDPQLNLEEMLSYLASYKGRSGTSCPNIQEWLDAFGDADGVFALTITSSLSGCYNAAVQAKEHYEAEHPGRRVCCLDSLSAGPELVVIAEKLRELIKAGKAFDEIEAEIRSYMKRTRLIFTLESLNNMAQNGRVSPLVAKACGLLGIRIVGQASSEGTLQPLHKSRGTAKALKIMLSEMKKNGRVILLTASPETIYERVKDSNDRPILNGNNNVEFIAEMMEKRREKYEAAADIVVQTDNKTVLQICEELISRLMELDDR